MASLSRHNTTKSQKAGNDGLERSHTMNITRGSISDWSTGGWVQRSYSIKSTTTPSSGTPSTRNGSGSTTERHNLMSPIPPVPQVPMTPPGGSTHAKATATQTTLDKIHANLPENMDVLNIDESTRQSVLGQPPPRYSYHDNQLQRSNTTLSYRTNGHADQEYYTTRDIPLASSNPYKQIVGLGLTLDHPYSYARRQLEDSANSRRQQQQQQPEPEPASEPEQRHSPESSFYAGSISPASPTDDMIVSPQTPHDDKNPNFGGLLHHSPGIRHKESSSTMNSNDAPYYQHPTSAYATQPYDPKTDAPHSYKPPSEKDNRKSRPTSTLPQHYMDTKHGPLEIYHPVNSNLSHSFQRRQLGPQEKSQFNQSQNVVGVVPVYASQVDSPSSFPHKNSLQTLQGPSQQDKMGHIVSRQEATASYQTPPLGQTQFQDQTYPESSGSDNNDQHYTAQDAPHGKTTEDSTVHDAAAPRILLASSSTQAVNKNKKQVVTTTPEFPQDPQTPSLMGAKSEVRDKPPQRPLPLPKMRNGQVQYAPQQQHQSQEPQAPGNRQSSQQSQSFKTDEQLFATRNGSKRHPTQRTMLQSPLVAAAAANRASSVAQEQRRQSSTASVARRQTPNTPINYPQIPEVPFKDDRRMMRPSSGSTVASTLVHNDIEKAGGGDPSSATTDQFGRPLCNKQFARLLLCMFIIFPPCWLLMGTGFFDEPVGVIPRLEKRIAVCLSLVFFVLALVGMIVGLAVGT